MPTLHSHTHCQVAQATPAGVSLSPQRTAGSISDGQDRRMWGEGGI